MSDSGELLAQAKLLYRAGRLREAEELCRRIHQSGAANAETYYLQGLACQALGRASDAVASMRQVIRIEPDHVDAQYRLGSLLAGQSRLDDAISCFLHVLRRDDRHVSACFELANARWKQAKYDEAAHYYRGLLTLEPDHAGALTNLGSVLRELGVREEALACCQRAALLDPNSAAVQNNLGVLLMDNDRPEEAVGCFAQALRLRHSYPDAHANWATALLMQYRPQEALVQCELALSSDPTHIVAHQNAAVALLSQGKFGEALARARRAVILNPDHAGVHCNYALLLLQAGRFAEGWREYEWRCKLPDRRPSSIAKPRWAGESLDGRTILLQTEQGLGDSLQFARYAQLVKDRGATVLVQCEPALARMLRSCSGVDQIVTIGESLPAFDLYAPLLSLPGLFETSVETIPAAVPYLAPDLESVNRWHDKLGDDGSFKIGIAWRGNVKNAIDRRRSIPLAEFAPLASVPGVRLLSLQVGQGRDELVGVARDWRIVDVADALDDLGETAALMRNLDLVISCDSAPCHLAGALGIPVWVALAFAPDWRWLLAREDSPWYPTMRLFRQTRPGDWQGVFRRIADALAPTV